MTATVVRYQAKPDRADENQQLIEAVFADLAAREPQGFTYQVFRLEDGVSFVHVVIEHDVAERRLAPGRPRVPEVRAGHRRPLRRSAARDGRDGGRPSPGRLTERQRANTVSRKSNTTSSRRLCAAGSQCQSAPSAVVKCRICFSQVSASYSCCD